MKALRETIDDLWKIDEGLNLMEVELDLWLFSFNSERKQKRILDMEPWNFQGSMMLLKEIDDPSDTGWRDYSLAKFWVQLHNLPLRDRVEEISVMLGERTSICLEVDTDGKGRCLGRYIQVWVLMDIARPQRFDLEHTQKSTHTHIWVEFKYERLPDFFFIYDRIGHLQRECTVEYAENVRKTRNYDYGGWL